MAPKPLDLAITLTLMQVHGAGTIGHYTYTTLPFIIFFFKQADTLSRKKNVRRSALYCI